MTPELKEKVEALPPGIRDELKRIMNTPTGPHNVKPLCDAIVHYFRKDESMAAMIYCLKCDARTNHQHMHDAAHGIAGTHMAGTERFVCSVCGNTILPQEGKTRGLPFILDKS